MNKKNVLFLCTGNSARSIIAEVCASSSAFGLGKLCGFSAGSKPAGAPNPFALKVLNAQGLNTDGARSKSWQEFAAADAPKMDFVFTVCDNAADEACPIFPGAPTTAHWGIADPAAVEGSDAEKTAAFETAFAIISQRIQQFAALDLDALSAQEITRKAREIAAADNAATR